MINRAALAPPYPSAPPIALRRRFAAFLRSRAGSPAWVRPSLAALLALTALLYLWDLNASGWGNAFYAAAVEAGTKSWKAFLFGSFDASNFITVDKPPASLWVMELSARIFGVNSWSVLAPQALEGVAAVGVLYATVRRRCGPVAGLIAGAVLALTPVAALMFRFDNPDALLVLLLVGSAYAFTRSLERGATRWLVIAGALVGAAFLTKMLQAFIVLPVFAGVYMLAAPVPLRRRIWQVVIAGCAVIVASGWWVALVSLWPAWDRPYIGGSTDNSILNLIFGYNGFGRITGSEAGSVGGTGVSGSMWGPTGITRLFNADFGSDASWLIPASLIGCGAVLWVRRRMPRTDGVRAQALIWGGWLVLTGLVFSFAEGIIHPYYTVALAPAIGALLGIGAVAVWVHRRSAGLRIVGALAVATSAVWAFVLMDRSPAFLPWLRVAILCTGLACAVALLAMPMLRRRVTIAVALAAVAVLLAAPAVYSLDTALTPHSGAIPSAGPAVTAAGGSQGPGGGFGGRFGGGFAGGAPPFVGGIPGAGGAGNPFTGNGFGGGFGGGAPGGFAGGGFAGPGRGAGGGLLNASTPDSAMVAALRSSASSYTWVAATIGANDAAGYQLASGDPVMAIGGFNGTDPWPTLAALESLVAKHEIHYFIPGGGMGPGGGNGTASAIEQWVESHFTTTQIGGTTVYDLSHPS